MNEISQPYPTVGLHDLHINQGEKLNRKVLYLFNNMQAKYNKDPESTLAYINSLSGGANKQQQKKKPKIINKKDDNKLIGEYDLNIDTYCLKCKIKTNNKPRSKVFDTGKNIRIECECATCGSKKSQFVNEKFVNENMKKNK